MVSKRGRAPSEVVSGGGGAAIPKKETLKGMDMRVNWQEDKRVEVDKPAGIIGSELSGIGEAGKPEFQWDYRKEVLLAT